MHRVEKPEWPPHSCAITGRADAPWYIDTGNNLPWADPHIYLSKLGAEQVATELGWVDPVEMVAALEQAEARIADLERENNELQQAVDAVDVLESHNYTARKKTGRPRRVTADA